MASLAGMVRGDPGAGIPPAAGAADEDESDRALSVDAGRQAERLATPPVFTRPPGRSPFGVSFPEPRRVALPDRPLLRLTFGDLDPADPDALLRDLPAALRHADGEIVLPGRRGRLAAGLDYAMLDRGAIDRDGLDAVLRRIQDMARVVGYLPDASLLLYIEPPAIGRLARSADVAYVLAMPPAARIDPEVGRRPLFEKRRALDSDLLLVVAPVPGAAPGLREEILRVPGVREATESAPGGSAYVVRADYRALPALARLRDVLHIQESLEMVAQNAKNAPTLQAGSAEDALQIRPFDDAGVDGGGIDTNGDGRRINDGSDAVPPQIVGVIDNGISLDTPSFAQTRTQVTITGVPVGPSHRKVHSIIPVRDNGSDCDAPLSGSGSHGNLVASVIAAYPSEVGAFATRSGIGGPGEPRGVDLDGVARGARIIVSDVADATRCTINSFIERGGNVDPGSLLARMNELICPKSGGTGACTALIGGATEVHLAITAFGAPTNFATGLAPSTSGIYPQESADIDTFLYNNRDFMVFAPAGNYGGLIGANRMELALDVLPDLFDGTDQDDCPVPCTSPNPHPIQIVPPATAKNLIAVGVSRSDCFTFFGTSDCETRVVDFTSRGPASRESLRMAPILVAPGSDLVPSFETASIAAFRSRDNDNAPPVDAQIDAGNFGSSFSAANVTGAAAIVRDYFAQGFYPTGSRVEANRVATVSGALVKAALVASAKFETRVETQGQGPNDTVPERNLRRTRGMDMGTIAGIPIGVMGNSEQGYGRPVLTQVLPLANWSKEFVLNPNAPSTPEHPARGLLVWDDLATGEPPIDNAHVSQTHVFRVASPRTVFATGGGLAILRGELRVGLAWADPPSPPGSGGPLVNDLDLTLEGPGRDNCLGVGDVKYDGTVCAAGTEADNRFYDGNVYSGGNNNAVTDQFSKVRVVGGIEVHDKRNPQEGIHVNSDPNEDRNFSDSPLHVGTWRVTVKRGAGGATPGSITVTGPNEDVNGNRRLDPGEDTNGNGLLDLGGQTYALVVSGPVFLAEAPPARGPSSFPQSGVSLGRIRYSCSDAAAATVFDGTAGAGAGRAHDSTTFSVRSASGLLTDTESGVAFTDSAPAGTAVSAGVPVRLGTTFVANNGILEADTGSRVVAVYAPPGQAPVVAEAQVDCSPDLINASFTREGSGAIGEQDSLLGGCDDDGFLDAGETVVYGVALLNRSRTDDYSDVAATLTASGPGAMALRILDSPQRVGRLPGGGGNGVFFHIQVDPATVNAIAFANRRATLTLTLDTSSRGQRLARQSYSFEHVLNADRETFHYSTDYPGGGREVRDLNRSLSIDRPDLVNPFRGFTLPDEDITFSSLFVPGATFGGTPIITNAAGEDLNNNGVLDEGEDVIPDGRLDGWILCSSSGPSACDKVPWHFDNNDGGWVPFRHPGSTPANITANPLWEYKTNGWCGFQTATGGLGHYGIWHTGDGNGATPAASGPACDNFAMPRDPATPPMVEMVFDVLHSPIIAKVHQDPDARGFAYGVEFQRLALNLNDQVNNGAYTGAGINIDNDLDNDGTDCLLCQELDPYYTRRGGGWPYNVFALSATTQYFDGGEGIDPHSTAPFQRTFGPRVDPDGSLSAAPPTFTGDEKGFPGFTQNTNLDSSSPIPQAPPELLKYPQTSLPFIAVCSGGPTPGDPCQVAADCGPDGTCTPVTITDAGPVRNFDTTLVGFEGGFASETLVGVSAPENAFFFNPGPAGKRWEIGIGFYAIENLLAADYGFGIDDVVFEWDEFHPQDESQFSPPHTPACSRFGQPGQRAGGQCATIAVDRTNLYECEATVAVSVFDPKLPPATTSVLVAIVTDSDSVVVSSSRFRVLAPGAKRFTLAAVPGSPGLFRGAIPFTGMSNDSSSVHVSAGTDQEFTVYYEDPACDGDGDGVTGETSFDNLDGDGVPAATDDCPDVYDPAQQDSDGDGIGDLCDDCLTISDPAQVDTDKDGAGDACEFDDLDGDGYDNALDNCPDVFNWDQYGHCVYTNGAPTGPCFADAHCTAGTGGVCDLSRGIACANPAQDLDGDGVTDALDNCVLTANPGQEDTDHDRAGDACDGDCPAASLVRFCSIAPSIPCLAIPGWGDPVCPAGGVCQTGVRHPQGAVCSTVDDDADFDGVTDRLDDCPAIYNPGLAAQRDTDGDGRGDACDSPAAPDDDSDGIPDDIVSFRGVVSCRNLPLASLTILSVQHADLDGDHDAYPDTGETERVTVTIFNGGPAPALTGALFALTSTDPDVACITSPTIPAVDLPVGATVTLGSLDPAQPGFTFRASNSLQTIDPLHPATIDFCLTVTAHETSGTSASLCFSIVADLDTPQGSQTFVAGPDGVPGTPDDGTIQETFDVDRDGDGLFTINDVFRRTDTGTGLVEHASYMRGSANGDPPGTIAGAACGGFTTLAEGNRACLLDPDFPMDWHLHCAPGTSACPNVESGTCVGGCSYATPANGRRALSTPNSMHMGAHFDLNDSLAGDSTHFRALQAFVSAPINLALFPRPGDLILSMYHIADLVDNYAYPENVDQCVDCADVQIQSDGAPDAAVDDWGAWEKLVPFQNVYDHKFQAWSVFGPYYCEFTPRDAGPAPPPAPPGAVQELMCYPQGAWSSCGSTTGTSQGTTFSCPGPGTIDPSGAGVWVQTKFNLASYVGRRVRVRWIGSSWTFDAVNSSYYEAGPGWSNQTRDDGWWLDDISITGALEKQFSVFPDTKPPPATTCPAGCDPGPGDHGTSVVLRVTDVSGNVLDGISTVAVAGQAIRVSAAQSTLPGGCPGGAPQFRFLRDGVLVQDWSSREFFLDSPERLSTYRALVRCGSDFACTSSTGASVDVPVYSGDGGDAVLGTKTAPGSLDRSLGVTRDRLAGTTTLSWFSPVPTVDVYRGSVGADLGNGQLIVGSQKIWQLAGTGCLMPNVVALPATGSGFNGTGGPMDQTIDPDPAIGLSTFYLVAPQTSSGLSVNGLGCANAALCSIGACESGGAPCQSSGGACGTCRRVSCNTKAQTPGLGAQPPCPSGGICLDVDPGAAGACPGSGDPRKVVRQVDPTALCP